MKSKLAWGANALLVAWLALAAIAWRMQWDTARQAMCFAWIALGAVAFAMNTARGRETR